ncbi:MAG: hypothetical protein K0M40_04065 [Prolixibacteraceae bacterium]|nr:hypothetical protein [Prolixibacteraceae bacterium]
MKSLLLILVMMVFMVGFGYSAQPLRKPFIQVKVDGKPTKTGEVLSVKPGQKLMVDVEMEGGRRDYCKFPDIYADITGTGQILSRGKDGITYQVDGKKSEWKLIKEEIRFAADEFLQVKPTDNQSISEVIVSNQKFSQSYLKITVKASWQFAKNEHIRTEENNAETTLYFKIAGESDVWFSTQNIKATGIKNELVHEKLQEVQSACDSIELNFYRLNFTAVQQSIRNLQNSVNTLKSILDEVKTSNPSYKAKVIFIGLPSDHPFSDISALLAIKNNWDNLGTSLNDQKQQLAKLPAQANKESKDELVKIIAVYVDWQYQLPQNTFKIISRYIPELTAEKVQMPGNIHFIAEEKTVTNYPQTIDDLNAFLDQRILELPDEIQKINTTQTRLQAVRLFDGMLRSYFSSINWAEWQSTRGF